jgi:hypothetical protein
MSVRRDRLSATFASILLMGALSGCAAHFVVKPATPTAKGFRIWSPKPYLLVTDMALDSDTPKAAAQNCEQLSDPKAKEECKTKQASGTPQNVKDGSVPPKLQVRVIYLPGDEYAVTSSGGGIGTFKGSIQLANGWLLTGMNQESDAKVAETITAVATLVSKLLPTGVAVAGTQEAAAPNVAVPVFLMFEIDTKNNALKLVDQPGCLVSALRMLKEKEYRYPGPCKSQPQDTK